MTKTLKVVQRVKQLETLLRTSRTRLEICLGRMRACTNNPQPHPVSIDEIPAWCDEISELLGDVPRITDEEWNTILLSLRIKLKSAAAQGSDREARDWRRDLRDVIETVANGEYGEINDTDWTEIYYSLTDGDVEGAKYIVEKIGPDGKVMWTGPGRAR